MKYTWHCTDLTDPLEAVAPFDLRSDQIPDRTTQFDHDGKPYEVIEVTSVPADAYGNGGDIFNVSVRVRGVNA